MLIIILRLTLAIIYPNLLVYADTNSKFANPKIPVRKDISHIFLAGAIYKKAINRIHEKTFNKTNKTSVLGDTLSFFVRNILDQERWNKITAKLLYDSLSVAIWMDTSAFSSLLKQEQQTAIINGLKNQLLNNTSALSVNPEMGIYNIMNHYFGSPPNVDGDGKVDILLLDIKDDFENSGSFVAGFFDPNDMTENVYSNNRDMLYVDIYPNILYQTEINIENASATIAHEYQHLIHINYEGNAREYIFINEGLSELAEIVCGFKPRAADFYFKNSSRSLLSWNFVDPIPDYSRASLWMNYLFEQIGYDNINLLLQSPLVGLDGIENILNQTSLKSFDQVFSDWIRANFINDSDFNPEFGYKHPLRQDIKFASGDIIDNLPHVENLILARQSAAVVEFPFTRELKLQFQDRDSKLNSDALLIFPDTSLFIEDLSLDPIQLHTNYFPHGSIRLLFKNYSRAFHEEDQMEIFPFLATGKKTIALRQLLYDDGISDSFFQNASYFLLKGFTQKLAIAFSPKKAWLKSISLKTLFLNELQGSPFFLFEPRDINIRVALFKNNKPDSFLTESQHINFKREFGNLRFEEFSMIDDYANLSSLQDSFCIIFSNDPDDSNFVAVGMDSSTASSTFAFLDYDRNGIFKWQTMDSVKIGQNQLNGWNVMVRANMVMQNENFTNSILSAQFENSFRSVSIKIDSPFSVDTLKTMGVVIMPNSIYKRASKKFEGKCITFSAPLETAGNYRFLVHLQEKEGFSVIDTVFNWSPLQLSDFFVYNNYPNPFNNSTKVPFISLQDGFLYYDVYNILGQKVFSKKAGFYTRGKHTINLSFADIVSGIYFLRFRMKRANRITSHTQKVLFIK